MLPSDPDDNSRSNSRFVTNFFVSNGTEFSLEVRSPSALEGTRRLGELVLWKSYDSDRWTMKIIEQDE
jgi:hypothetical protein